MIEGGGATPIARSTKGDVGTQNVWLAIGLKKARH